MPYRLSDDHIDFILGDIRARGVEMESLQQSLLDHICCILEEELESEKDFEQKYEEVVMRFFEKDLSEIEKETRLLLKNKHYYTMKKVLYILLFVSLGINAVVITNFVWDFVQREKDFAEIRVQKNVTLKEGIDYAAARLSEKYPGHQIRQKICIAFLSNHMPSDELMEEHFDKEHAELMEITVDSARNARKQWRDEAYRRTDSLAGAFPEVTFIAAFQRSSKDVKETITEYSTKTKHLYYLDNMNKLYSGISNSIGRSEGIVLMNLFVISADGKLLYRRKNFAPDYSFEKELIDVLKPAH